MTPLQLLDNIAWHSLTGPQAACSAGTRQARRDAQRRGLARRLMLLLLCRELQRGEMPFLHVLRAKRPAHGLYARRGLRDHQELTVRVLSRSP